MIDHSEVDEEGRPIPKVEQQQPQQNQVVGRFTSAEGADQHLMQSLCAPAPDGPPSDPDGPEAPDEDPSCDPDADEPEEEE